MWGEHWIGRLMAIVANVLRDKLTSAFLVVVSDRGKESQAAAIASLVIAVNLIADSVQSVLEAS